MKTRKVQTKTNAKFKSEECCWVLRLRRGLTTDTVEQTFLGSVDTSSTASSFITVQLLTVDGMVGVRLLDDSSCVCWCHQETVRRHSESCCS